MKILIPTIVRTCIACPSQWEARTDDDRPVYGRFRHDRFALYVGAPGEQDDAWGMYVEPPVIEIYGVTNDEYAGFMDDQEFHEILIQFELSSDPSYVFPSTKSVQMEIVTGIKADLVALIKKEADLSDFTEEEIIEQVSTILSWFKDDKNT